MSPENPTLTPHPALDGTPTGVPSPAPARSGAAGTPGTGASTSAPESGPAGQPQLETATPARVPGFSVSLPQFEGPFDLLLTLIARKRLDVTELALAEVTDEFLATMRADWELEHASEFLVVAATLLALKAHRLLPHEEGEEDEEDLELIEARDLLFARLLQYRAFKEVAAFLRERAESASRSRPRVVGLPPELASLLPKLVSAVPPSELARLAARAFTRPGPPEVETVHLHEPVPVAEQLSLLAWRLRGAEQLTFTQLTEDLLGEKDPDRVRATIVARFLSLLILHREGAIDLSQQQALGEITVRWIGDTEALTGVLAAGASNLEEEFA